jgi:hypothetical protein
MRGRIRDKEASVEEKGSQKTAGWRTFLEIRSFLRKERDNFKLLSRQVCHPAYLLRYPQSLLHSHAQGGTFFSQNRGLTTLSSGYLWMSFTFSNRRC